MHERFPTNGKWICRECGQSPAFNADWRWTGENWQHRHEDGVFENPALRRVEFEPNPTVPEKGIPVARTHDS